ncbi:MAG: acyl-CoA dehydratase activase-related protein [Eubacterium sp.]|nr:acyl-CoA dehydratase activase-related protein [Eubacterium sp.]
MKKSIGIDIGSTTVKVVVLSEDNKIEYNNYKRHYSNVRETVIEMLKEIYASLNINECFLAVTGSGGLKLAGATGTTFVQEVVAVSFAVKNEYPDTDVVIELGGEDAKIIYLTGGVEQRMNGICAGGTGAFIDQMAALMQTDADGINELAKGYKDIYPIAARCGVFAKTDIQPLINDGAAKEDLAASVLQAVVNQTISGLACGRKIKGRVVYLGGPLHFLTELRAAFSRTLNLGDDMESCPENAHLFAALGAAYKARNSSEINLGETIENIAKLGDSSSDMNILQALFKDEDEYREFRSRQSEHDVVRADLSEYEGNCYLGIDGGSTTIKIVLISEGGELLYSFYGGNMGSPLDVAKENLLDMMSRMNPKAHIARACATGYGEALLKNAFNLDEGEVETIAHTFAARYFVPDVTSIIDIGGQDMKCIMLKDGYVDSIVLNEACSSGCGSFLEQFAKSLGYNAAEFANIAVKSKKPVDLGTRCTVFMNSNVKQAQKEGADVADIAAGLAYSVVKNALFKVIKLRDAGKLGKKIVVQGGTFYNDAVLRCFEIISGREAVRPEISGIMGAFGAALIARERSTGQSSILSYDKIKEFTYKTSTTYCKGCENKCRLTINHFGDSKRYISGNRCERALGGGGAKEEAPNLFAYKLKRIFDYEPLPENKAPMGEIGIPRALNMYENYPFWAVFFREIGFRTVLSPLTSRQMYESGMDTIPSESQCYPAKIVHGHIEWLIKSGVKTIFYPCVFYERDEGRNTQNIYNCPMVISYPENIRNNVDDLENKNVRYLNPFISFENEDVLAHRLCEVAAEYWGIGGGEVRSAVHKAWKELLRCKEDILNKGKEALKWIEKKGKTGVILAGRPYHLDPEINHGIPKMIQGYGLAVLTEDSVAGLNPHEVKLRTTNQWVYHSRLYSAAEYAATRDDLEIIQLNSFGCGVDAVTIDQISELCEQTGKMYTLLKIDEVNNLGAARIRVRSMIAALKERNKDASKKLQKPYDYERVEYTDKMQQEKYTILCPGMITPHFDFMQAALRSEGYNFVMMWNEGQDVYDLGVKYVNNDTCYPCIITTGQILAEVMSGKYDTDHLAVVMAQTGGGCRASNYVGFIRKALAEAGYGHIPVISANPNGMETQSGFKIGIKTLLKIIKCLIYGDLLSKVSHRMRPYEVEKGSTNELYAKWMEIIKEDVSQKSVNWRSLKKNCRAIIDEFDAIKVSGTDKKVRVGIVGEVLVKYMPMANNHLSDLIEAEGAEVVIPDVIEFLEYCFWNAKYRAEVFGKSKKAAKLVDLLLWVTDYVRKDVMTRLDKSIHFKRNSSLENIRADGAEVLQLGNQCGEGWFLPGEVIDLIKEKVNNIVCVQPFGCLPNHIVGKGIVKKVKSLYPQANIVAIDYDASASRVNQLNRIKLMMEVAKEEIL